MNGTQLEVRAIIGVKENDVKWREVQEIEKKGTERTGIVEWKGGR